jgi:hypothetical protein
VSAEKFPVPDVLAPVNVVVVPVLKFWVVVVQFCPNELKEATTKAANKKVEVKILLMTIKFKFKRIG